MATASGYIVKLKDGSTLTIDNAVRSHKDGAGTRLYDKDNQEVASFHDGLVDMAYPVSAKVEAAPKQAETGGV